MPSDASSAAPSRTRFIVLLWLGGAMALAYIARNAVSTAESTMRHDLGLTKEQSGWLMSAFYLSYALCQIPTAQFGRWLGTRRALPLFAAVWSVATSAMAFAGGLFGLMVTRLLEGISQAGLIPTCMRTVSRWFPTGGRAFATGTLGSAMSVGGALGVWLAGLALDREHGWGWSWQTMFLMFGLPGLVWAAGFLAWFRDEPATHPAVNAGELREISDGADPASSAESGPVVTPWLAIATSPALWWICGQQLCRAAGYVFFTSWFATYLQETRGVGIARSGFLNMLPLLAVVFGGIAGGALSDWLLRTTGSRAIARKFMGAACLFLCAALIFVAMTIADTLGAVLVISAGSFFAALAGPCAYTITIDMGGSNVATVNATMNMMGNLGAWAFPIAVPWLLRLSGNWDLVVGVFGALYVVGAICWLLLNPVGNILDQSFARSTRPAAS